MKKFVATLVVMSLLAGCAGRSANPVPIQQYGDDSKSCAALEHDLRFVEGEIRRLIPDTHKAGKNVALGVTGIFFLVPLFFMDLSQAEQVEVNALRQRHNHLLVLAKDRGCAIKEQASEPFEKSSPPAAEFVAP